MTNTFHDLAQFYKALGDETRLELVALLARQHPERALCVGRLARGLGVTASAVSQHLRVLKDLGLVRACRVGYRIHYYLDPERLSDFEALARDCLGAGFAFVVAVDPENHAPDGSARCCGRARACSHPRRATGGKCTPEQIRACHGDVAGHPCEKQGQEERTEQV